MTSATARDAERLCKEFYPIEDEILYDTENRATFGVLVGLHYLFAAFYALHLYMQWFSKYLRIDVEQQPSPKQPLAAITVSNKLETLKTSDAIKSLSGHPSTVPRLALTSRIHKKLFVFSVANCMSNMLIGTSWLFWMFGKTQHDINSSMSLMASIQYQVVFYAIFPVGTFCFLISAFAFSDMFVALCISKNPQQPPMRLLSWRYICVPIVLFLGIAASGYATLGYQIEAGQLQRKCFENAGFGQLIKHISTGHLFSFDFNCSSYAKGSAAAVYCNDCNLGLCRIQEKGTNSFVAFLLLYVLAIVIALVSALRMWLKASRQISSLVRGLLELLRWKTGFIQSSHERRTQAEVQSMFMEKPFAVVWLGLMVIVLALIQRISVMSILVDSMHLIDDCTENDSRFCGPCDTSCRSLSEVLSNWILMDPNVLSFSSMAAELLVSAIMGAIQLWLSSKSKQGSNVRATVHDAKELEVLEVRPSKQVGENMALAILQDIHLETSARLQDNSNHATHI